MLSTTKFNIKALGVALCAGLVAITAIPAAAEAGDWRHGRDRYGNPDREWVGERDRHHHRRHHHREREREVHHYYERAPRVVERVVERPVYVMPQPMMPMPVQDQGINLNFTIPLR